MQLADGIGTIRFSCCGQELGASV